MARMARTEQSAPLVLTARRAQRARTEWTEPPAPPVLLVLMVPMARVLPQSRTKALR